MDGAGYLLVSFATFGGLTLLGLSMVLGVIAVIRILASGGTVRGYPHALFSIVWSGAVTVFVLVALVATTFLQTARQGFATLKDLRSVATFTVELGELEFVKTTNREERVALFTADLAVALHDFRSMSSLRRPASVAFEVGPVEATVDAETLIFRVTSGDRNRLAFETVVREIKSLTDRRLDETFLKECKHRTWGTSFNIERFD
jgi:hypothetical protein